MWFSETILSTAFKARKEGDECCEKGTHIDAVIGHFRFRAGAKVGLELRPDAKQFTAIEAKINSPLSAKVKNAKKFDQTARSVACMAEVPKQSRITPAKIKPLFFLVLAPRSKNDAGIFSTEIKKRINTCKS